MIIDISLCHYKHDIYVWKATLIHTWGQLSIGKKFRIHNANMVMETFEILFLKCVPEFWGVILFLFLVSIQLSELIFFSKTSGIQ